MKNIPKKYLSTKDRKEMWKESKKIIEKIEKSCKFKEVYAVGSMISKKKKVNDIDFVVIAKVKSKESNSAFPVDLLILPENVDTKEYLEFFNKYMKKKYGSSFKPVRLK